MDLELDYYDYNVVNAGAAPGSYLGMDPAFLVYIPPLTEDEDVPEEADEEEEDPQYEEIEGAAEYRDSDPEEMIKPKKFDHECQIHDEIIMEYKARLGEGLLPIHRVLEESRVRVSEESLSSTSEAVPKAKYTRKMRLPRRMRKSSRTKVQSKDALSSESSTQSLDVQETPKIKVNDLDTPRTRRKFRDLDRDYCEIINVKPPKTPNLPRRRGDAQDLNTELRKTPENVVNIPMAEFSRKPSESPVKVHGRSSEKITKDAVIETSVNCVEVVETKKSFYDLINEGEDGIKFADDDDEYIDNKIAA